jgi:hypothetical protein
LNFPLGYLKYGTLRQSLRLRRRTERQLLRRLKRRAHSMELRL